MSNLDSGWFVSVGRGPRRHETLGGEPDLRPAREAISVLVQKAAANDEARAALIKIVNTTPWAEIMDWVLGLLLKVTTKDELYQLGRIFFDNFWDLGEEGGGEAMPRRLFVVANEMRVRGDELRDYFPQEERENFDYALKIGVKAEQEIPVCPRSSP